MTLCLGIDQSYSGFGLALLDGENGKADVVTLAFPKERFGNGIDRLQAIADRFTSHLGMIKEYGQLDHVAMEGYARGRANWREEAGELGAVVKLVLRTQLPEPVCYPTIVPPTSLKKFIAGTGGASKDVILLRTFQKWGRSFTDHNAADAYGLAEMAKGLVEGVELKYEQDVLAKLAKHTEMR